MRYLPKRSIPGTIDGIFTCLVNDGLSITPNVNLITNIGAGSDSTHFRERIEGITHVPANEITFPLKHPARIVKNREADKLTFDQVWLRPNSAANVYCSAAWLNPAHAQYAQHRLRIRIPFKRLLSMDAGQSRHGRLGRKNSVPSKCSIGSAMPEQC